MLALEFTETSPFLISIVFLGQLQYTYNFTNISFSDPGFLTTQETMSLHITFTYFLPWIT